MNVRRFFWVPNLFQNIFLKQKKKTHKDMNVVSGFQIFLNKKTEQQKNIYTKTFEVFWLCRAEYMHRHNISLHTYFHSIPHVITYPYIKKYRYVYVLIYLYAIFHTLFCNNIL